MTAWILLAAALLLIVACGVFVAAEFAFVTVDRARSTRPPPTGDTAARGPAAGAALAVDPALRRPGRHHRHQPGDRLPRRARDRRPDRRPARRRRRAARARSTPVAPWPSAWPLGTVLTMIFGELVPKNLALARPMETARATQRFQRGFTAVDRLPIRVLNGSANAVVRRLGIEPQEELRSARSSTELASLIQRSADQGTLDADTAELMERSVEFGSRTAGEIMTPRVRTVSVEANDRARDVIELARATGHSRFPVLDADDDVVGTVHVKHAVALPVHERADDPGQAPDGQADRRARLAAARPAAGAAAQGRLPDGRRPRRVRRPRRHRHPRGRGRGDRRRHRRRARPARRPAPASAATAAGRSPGCCAPTRSRTSPASRCPSTRTTTPSPGSSCARSAGSPSAATSPRCRCPTAPTPTSRASSSRSSPSSGWTACASTGSACAARRPRRATRRGPTE